MAKLSSVSPHQTASLLFGWRAALLLLCCLTIMTTTKHTALAFSPVTMVPSLSSNSHTMTSSLYSSPPPRQPRRMLKKRRRNPQNRRNKNGSSTTPAQQFPWDTTESRPLVKSVAAEAGEDYWIDETELAKFEEQQQAIKNRKSMEGQVSKEKLWTEVKAPYKQNWIGYFSVGIAILSILIIKFPELLDQPTIAIPDL